MNIFQVLFVALHVLKILAMSMTVIPLAMCNFLMGIMITLSLKCLATGAALVFLYLFLSCNHAFTRYRRFRSRSWRSSRWRCCSWRWSAHRTGRRSTASRGSCSKANSPRMRCNYRGGNFLLFVPVCCSCTCYWCNRCTRKS